MSNRPLPAVRSPWMTPNREPNDQLSPAIVRGSGGGTGVYDEIEAGHPKVADAYARLASSLATMPVEWALDDPDAREQMVIDDLTALWEGCGADFENEISGPGSVLQQAVTYWSRGSCTFALRWVDSQTTGRRFLSFDGLDIEAYPVHPSSILRWNANRVGKLEGITQQTYSGSATIPRCDIVTCARMAVPGQFEGTSMSRPLVFLFERWKNIWMSSERNAWMQAGLITLNEPPGAGSDDRARANAALQDWMYGAAPYLILPDGWSVQFDAPADADMMPQIEKIDAYVDGTLGNQVAALSYAAHATRSLGEVLSEEQSRDASREIETFLGLFGSQFAAWVCNQIGYDGRLPRLQIVSNEVDADPADTVGTLAAAVGAGLLTWMPEDEQGLRMDLGLRTAAEAVAMSDQGCGCDSVSMRDAPGVQVIGADGRPWTAPAALEGVEVFVTWADNDDERRGMDQALNDALEVVANRHRAATWKALRDGWQPGEAAAVLNKFLPQYRAAMETYGRDIAMMVSRWTVEEAVRQGEADGTPRRRSMEASTALFSQVRDAADQRMNRAASGLMMAAEETARRVQSDVETAWRSGIPRRSFAPTFTALASPARPSAQLIESEGRVAAAADMAVGGEAESLGLEPARVVRTSVMDRRRCGHCANLSQTTFNLPEELARWEAMPLPDPGCAGGAARCRCGWLVEWRR